MPRLVVIPVVVLLAAGCGRPAPPAVSLAPAAAAVAAAYPARADLLVDTAPATSPPGWPKPGFPPLKSLTLGEANTPDPAHAVALKGELGKSLLDPAKANEGDDPKARDKVAAAVAQFFGTPLAPAVAVPGADAATVNSLRLDAQTLVHGSGVYRRWCVNCHGPAGAGDGPAAATLLPPPRDYRPGVFKFVSGPPDALGKPRRADLVRVLRRGIDGTAMPAFPDLPSGDLEAVVSYVIHLSVRGEAEFGALRKLVKAPDDAKAADEEVAAAGRKALGKWAEAEGERPRRPDPAVSAEDRLAAAARGHKWFTDPKEGAGCASCHLDYGRAANLKYDGWGNVVQPRNLFLGLYRGGRSADDLYARIYDGIAGSGMPSHKGLVDGVADGDKIWDLVHFVRAVGDPAGRADLRAKHGIRVE